MADWTVNNPIKIKHDLVPSRPGAPLDLRVFIRYQDDTTPTTNKYPPETEEGLIYTGRGAGAWDAIRERARLDQLTLDEGERLPADGATFVPTTAPTGKEQAVLDIQQAVRRRAALENYASLFGKAGSDLTGGAGSPTFDARRATLQAVIDNNVSSGANLNNRVLDEWAFQPVDSPGNARTPTWRGKTTSNSSDLDTAEAPSP